MSEITLEFTLVYNMYGGVPSFSNSQLSLIGYTDSWVWYQAALGSLGENYCMDAIGSHSRSQITDVRVSLFDGFWTGNVGGGDFLVYFNSTGSYVYSKRLDPIIWTPGPCLSNATFNSITSDDAIEISTTVSGMRSDDLLRILIHVRYDVKKVIIFSRLAFFQMSSDWYSKGDDFSSFYYGSAGFLQGALASSCAEELKYPGDYPYREELAGEAPWWFSLGPQESAEPGLGDRGLVVREWSAVLGGVARLRPAFSLFCERLELSPPADVGGALLAGDFVEAKLELLVLPRPGNEFQKALDHTGSATLRALSPLMRNVSEVVAAYARGHLTVWAAWGKVESHYPIRVCAPRASQGTGDMALFNVSGSALGFVPVVICGLGSHEVPAGGGLWMRGEGEGDFRLVNQAVHDSSDFWQTNFVPVTRTYDLVYNVEVSRRILRPLIKTHPFLISLSLAFLFCKTADIWK